MPKWLTFEEINKAVEHYDKLILDSGTIALATATLLLFLATLYLALSTKRLVVDSADNGRRQLRAYLCVTGGSFCFRPDLDPPRISVDVNFQNYGNSPAYDFKTRIHIAMKPASSQFDFVPDPEDLKSGNAASIMGPHQTANTGRGIFATVDDLNEIIKEEKIVYVWGRVDYVDAYDVKRYFIYRFIMKGPPSNNNFWPLRPHSSGYEAN